MNLFIYLPSKVSAISLERLLDGLRRLDSILLLSAVHNKNSLERSSTEIVS